VKDAHSIDETTVQSPTAYYWWWFRVDGGDGPEDWESLPVGAIKQVKNHWEEVEIVLSALPMKTGARIWIAATNGKHDKPGVQVHGVPVANPYSISLQGGGPVHPKPVVANVVRMERAAIPQTPDEIFWVVIRNSTNRLLFKEYQTVMNGLFGCAPQPNDPIKRHLDRESFLVSNVDSYSLLKRATELFVKMNCGVLWESILTPDPAKERGRRDGRDLDGDLQALWTAYLGESPDQAGYLPYLRILRANMDGCTLSSAASKLDSRLREKLTRPCLLELIWAYWMEEAMLVQTFNAITRRFQNLRSGSGRDPLAQLEVSPLRPLNNFLWGWVQEEMEHLTVRRRAYEYEHEYGFSLQGKALGEFRPADRRCKFLESFHNLLWKCTQFYRQDDNTTVKADGFQVLNAIKETHYVLSHGAHGQFGSLPSTARQEMLMQQWILSLPEMREFLGTRPMVPYPETWMDRVDTVKTLKGWTSTSVVHFRDLAVFGEQILLSVRWGAWSECDDPDRAANWARYWRAEVQGYVHAYRAATGVDLTADVTDPRLVQGRFLPPSVHLRNRLADQASR
jgi:hypothetical protein